MRSAKLRRLHFLNALFAPLTGSDLYLAGQIDAAIALTLDEATSEERPLHDPEFIKAAAQLFARLCAARPRHGFFHWDALFDETAGSPLFMRAGLAQGLKHIAPYAESTVLITNLHAAQRSEGQRWTKRRQREYNEILHLLRELTASRTRRGAHVNLLFL
jgi:hypothetical protein